MGGSRLARSICSARQRIERRLLRERRIQRRWTRVRVRGSGVPLELLVLARSAASIRRCMEAVAHSCISQPRVGACLVHGVHLAGGFTINASDLGPISRPYRRIKGPPAPVPTAGPERVRSPRPWRWAVFAPARRLRHSGPAPDSALSRSGARAPRRPRQAGPISTRTQTTGRRLPPLSASSPRGRSRQTIRHFSRHWPIQLPGAPTYSLHISLLFLPSPLLITSTPLLSETEHDAQRPPAPPGRRRPLTPRGSHVGQ